MTDINKRQAGERDFVWVQGGLILLVSVAMFVLFVLVIRLQQRNYVSEATAMVYQIKSETLKSNVMEIVQDIERFRKWEIQRDGEEIRSFGTQMAAEEGTIVDILQSPSGGSWLINGYRFYVWDEDTRSVVFASTQVEAGSLEELKALVREEMVVSTFFRKGSQTVVAGINDAMVDFRTKQYIYKKIHSLQFEDGSYIWVNEVVNYEGGENYAIRRIHPNLQGTEGMYLSTATEDVVGNLPYLAELEGVKAAGECYNTYYFKELNSDRISEKYTYSYLYEPYNWIISMGSYTSDIESYRVKLQQDSARLMTVGILTMAGLLALLLVLVTRLIRQSERLRFGKEREKLERVSTVDPLTGAVNRRGGMPKLMALLEECRHSGVTSCVVMIDIDFFKQINDTYGHETGDRVLSSLSGSIKRCFRSDDLLVRWGGDEFLLAVRGMGPEEEDILRRKLYHAAEHATIQAGGEEVPVRISTGAAVFQADDESYMDAVNRADRALYQAKRSGKGKLCTNW